MPLSALIERARQGDANAIARLITRSLAERGVDRPSPLARQPAIYSAGGR